MKKRILLNIIMVLIVFTFMAFSVYAAQSAVDLGTAGNYVILAKSGISTTGTTAITGNIGVSPIDSTAITGFGLIMDSSNEFATSSLVTGNIYAADYTAPTSSIMTTAISDMQTAYSDAAGRTLPDATELGAGDISGVTIAPGLYKWGTGVLINNGVTLSGGANDIWIFQIAQDLTVGNGAIITLSGGAQAKNIFWQVGGQATLGTTSNFKGNILSQTLIEMQTGATLNGRALAQTAVTLDANAVTSPGTAESTPPPETDNGSSCSPTWECTEWSACANEIQTRTCTDKWDCEKSSGKPAETMSCTPNQSSSFEKNQTNQGIGHNISQQISEIKEEIKSGDYNGSLGQLLGVKELAQDLKELRINGITAQTNLSITSETNSKGKTKLKTKLRNGQEREIKIMPDTASERALEILRLKVCSPYNNCTIQLKDVGNGEIERIQYEVQLDRHSRILGIFEKKMHVTVDVDAETGEVLQVHKPWWAFLATESAE